RRQREAGLRGLGQPLKSFRDSTLSLPVYQPGNKQASYLSTLGPLALPSKGSMAGVGAAAPDWVNSPARKT
ncbi:hypothetical protein ACFL00_05310, partial [Pseudomonadota bacterium]